MTHLSLLRGQTSRLNDSTCTVYLSLSFGGLIPRRQGTYVTDDTLKLSLCLYIIVRCMLQCSLLVAKATSSFLWTIAKCWSEITKSHAASGYIST